MSRKRSDAITALTREVASIEDDLDGLRMTEQAARDRATAARLELDLASKDRMACESRLVDTRQALSIIAKRDEVSEDVVKAMVTAAR